MDSQTGVWVYVALRTCTAVPFAVQSWKARRRVVWTLALVGADVVAPLFILGYALAPLRTAVGMWWTPLFFYSVIVEVLRIRSLYEELEEDSFLQAALIPFIGIALVPPLGAGFFLFFDNMFPGDWRFGGGVQL